MVVPTFDDMWDRPCGLDPIGSDVAWIGLDCCWIGLVMLPLLPMVLLTFDKMCARACGVVPTRQVSITVAWVVGLIGWIGIQLDWS